MNLERYPYFANDDSKEYTFYSDGPRGIIKKTVRYTVINNDPVTYNLGFGDENFLTGQVDDRIVSNNQDRNRVLVTVANTVIAFSEKYGNPLIYAEGNTKSRTRLYQMGISQLFEEIKLDFDVFGYRQDNWHPFERGINYEAFLLKGK